MLIYIFIKLINIYMYYLRKILLSNHNDGKVADYIPY